MIRFLFYFSQSLILKFSVIITFMVPLQIHLDLRDLHFPCALQPRIYTAISQEFSPLSYNKVVHITRTEIDKADVIGEHNTRSYNYTKRNFVCVSKSSLNNYFPFKFIILRKCGIQIYIQRLPSSHLWYHPSTSPILSESLHQNNALVTRSSIILAYTNIVCHPPSASGIVLSESSNTRLPTLSYELCHVTELKVTVHTWA